MRVNNNYCITFSDFKEFFWLPFCLVSPHWSFRLGCTCQRLSLCRLSSQDHRDTQAPPPQQGGSPWEGVFIYLKNISTYIAHSTPPAHSILLFMLMTNCPLDFLWCPGIPWPFLPWMIIHSFPGLVSHQQITWILSSFNKNNMKKYFELK